MEGAEAQEVYETKKVNIHTAIMRQAIKSIDPCKHLSTDEKYTV